MSTTGAQEQPEIRTTRLLLRAIKPEEDAADVFQICSQIEVRKYMTKPPMRSLAEAKSYLSTRTSGPRSLHYAIVDRVTDKVIGLVSSKRFPEIGYYLHPSFAGKGLATEAVGAFLPALWRHVPSGQGVGKDRAGEREVVDDEDVVEDEAEDGWDVVYGLCDVENGASQRVLEKCGFERAFLIKGEYRSPQVGLRDSVLWRLRRPEAE